MMNSFRTSMTSSYNRSGTRSTSGGSGSSGIYSSSSTRQHSNGDERAARRVMASRLVFLTCLLVVCILLGVGAHRLLTDSETQLAHEQFNAIATRALEEALQITLRKRLGVKAMAAVMSYQFPDAAQWPNVSMVGFDDIAKSIMDVSAVNKTLKHLGLCPFVTPDQLEAFEDYAYHIAFSQINDYPDHIGLRDFNGDGNLTQGVHGFDADLQIYRETNAQYDWDNQYNLFCPFLMHSATHEILLMNINSMDRFGKTVEEMITCANGNDLHMNMNNQTDEEQDEQDHIINMRDQLTECAILGDMMVTYDANAQPKSPGGLVVQPIYPKNNPTQVVGLVMTIYEWEETMAALFTNSREVNGIDCVLQTETQAISYHIQQGISSVTGMGDLHDPRYTTYGQSIELTSKEVFGYTSASYTLTLYPSAEFLEVYSTTNPLVTAIGSVCIVLFTAILFFLYDFFVRQEFHRKQSILEAKRRFVRFVSHEVRTPLNTICMGSDLLQQEMTQYQKTQQKNQNNNNNNKKKDLQDKLTDWSSLNQEVIANAKAAVNVLSDLLNYDKVETKSLHLELALLPIWALIQRTTEEFKIYALAKQICYKVDYSALLQQPPPMTTTETETAACNDDSDVLERGENNTSASKATFRTITSTRDLPLDVREQIVVGDGVRITQVLRNFLSNAVKFTPEKGNITVRVSWQQRSDVLPDATKKKVEFALERGDVVEFPPSGYLQVDVQDSGAGMSPQEVSTVFGEGVQFNVNKLQAGQGSGLGLFIAKGIAEQHGGQLMVSSEGHGHGSTFTMILPLYHAPVCTLPDNLKSAFEEREGPDSSEDTLEAFKILVVDDTDMNRKLLVRLLVGKGHTCGQAENGQVAVELMKAAMDEGTPYDVVLLDYEMPVMKGPEACRQMRELGCSAFCVGVTGNLLPEDILYFKAHGANCVLPKPINIRDLEATWVEHGVSTQGDIPGEYHPVPPSITPKLT
ncbi:respiration control sensor protein ArcB [Seminavis robusta]|uniref:histidine kinase n=1 Tax=Seminavis robusta TaxID=568900 RepID=A0A9N8H8N9_9STRA|nr:respiration control sensor protein ArcB [Seminavis robusta]|eukprot:Sro96_g049610.1 respiration control sensor protein ArcB (973) ;mRNA; r:65699-68921